MKLKKIGIYGKYGLFALIGGVLLLCGKYIHQAAFPSYKEQVITLLSPSPTEWLQNAEVKALQLSSDYRPTKYYVVSHLSREDHVLLMSSLGARSKEDSSLRYLFRLDEDISFPGWIGSDERSGVESYEVVTSQAALYFRRYQGALYTVVIRR